MIASPEPDGTAAPKYQTIADELAQSIRNGQLAAGEKLPPHRILAKRLGVTTGTISRAYASLERQGLASARVGDGTYVRHIDAGADNPLSHASAGPIDFAHNVAIATDEVSALQATFAELGREPERMADVLRYQPEAGARRHRQAGATWLTRFGTSGAWNRVMVTHGAQHALAGVLRTIARPGDTLLTEALSYPGMIALARSLRLQLIGLEMDEQGLCPQALEQAAQTFNTKLLFCSPTLHNPLTCTMSMARRAALAAIIRRRGLLLMEDVVHAAVLPEPPPALSTWVPEQSFLLASLSKVMAPGLRVGYLEASPEWLDKVAASIRADCWMVAPLMPEIVTRWIENGQAQRLIALQRQSIAERLALAHQQLAGLDYRHSEHHPHLWLPLPAPWRADQFAATLRQAGVLVRTAEPFTVGRSRMPHAVRVSLNTAPLDQLPLGLRTLVAVLNGTVPATKD